MDNSCVNSGVAKVLIVGSYKDALRNLLNRYYIFLRFRPQVTTTLRHRSHFAPHGVCARLLRHKNQSRSSVATRVTFRIGRHHIFAHKIECSQLLFIAAIHTARVRSVINLHSVAHRHFILTLVH